MMQLDKTHPIFESEMMLILEREGNTEAIKAREEYEKHQKQIQVLLSL